MLGAGAVSGEDETQRGVIIPEPGTARTRSAGGGIFFVYNARGGGGREGAGTVGGKQNGQFAIYSYIERAFTRGKNELFVFWRSRREKIIQVKSKGGRIVDTPHQRDTNRAHPSAGKTKSKA